MWTDNSGTSQKIRTFIVGSTIELRSSLTPAECLDRLRQNTDSYWKLFGSNPVVGWVRGHKFSGYKRINYRNSFRTLVVATFEADGHGCVIKLRFGVHPFVQVFMAIWLAFILGIGAVGTLAPGHGNAPDHDWMFIVIPLLMAAFGVGLYKFGRWLARNEQAFLLDFMKTILAAKLAV